MRIEAYNQVAALYKAGSVSRTTGTKAVAQARDEVSISRAGKDYQLAKQAVANASDIREDKVAEMKKRVNSGNYNVDPSDFAAKLLEKFNDKAL